MHTQVGGCVCVSKRNKYRPVAASELIHIAEKKIRV